MKPSALIALLLLALTLIVGCAGAAAPSNQSRAATDKGPVLGVIPAPAPTSAPAMPPAAAGAVPGVQESAGGDRGLTVALDPAATERMVVYTGNLTLEVNDTEATVAKVADILKASQGYIANRSLDRDNKGQVRGTITIRVPAGSLEAVLVQIRALGLKTLHEDAKSDDVTAEFTDLDARRKNLEAYEVELTKLLDTVRERTGKAEDILAVYNQLTEVRGQIEQIKGRQNYLQNTSSFATYTIQFVPHVEVVVEGEAGWNPGGTARQALNSLVLALQGLADVGITLLLFILPVLVLLALPFLILFFIVRAFWRRRTPNRATTAKA